MLTGSHFRDCTEGEVEVMVGEIKLAKLLDRVRGVSS